jgi:hypothetical protein
LIVWFLEVFLFDRRLGRKVGVKIEGGRRGAGLGLLALGRWLFFLPKVRLSGNGFKDK